MKELKDVVILNDNDCAVSLIADYFATSSGEENKGKFDTHVKEFDAFYVGAIEAVGSSLDESLIGKIIYFQKDISNIVKIKGYKDYHLVDYRNQKLLVRKDQTRDNY